MRVDTSATRCPERSSQRSIFEVALLLDLLAAAARVPGEGPRALLSVPEGGMIWQRREEIHRPRIQPGRTPCRGRTTHLCQLAATHRQHRRSRITSRQDGCWRALFFVGILGVVGDEELPRRDLDIDALPSLQPELAVIIDVLYGVVSTFHAHLAARQRLVTEDAAFRRRAPHERSVWRRCILDGGEIDGVRERSERFRERGARRGIGRERRRFCVRGGCRRGRGGGLLLLSITGKKQCGRRQRQRGAPRVHLCSISSDRSCEGDRWRSRKPPSRHLSCACRCRRW